MKKCLKCGSELKNRVIVNGSVKIINKRKYCLDCSPFGKRNTKRLHLPQRNQNSKKQCPQCGKDFKWNKNNICWTCRSFNRRKQNRTKGITYLGGKCSSCGINDPDVLTFHHTDREKKQNNLSSIWHNNWENIKQELNICKLLCANCHIKLHRKEIL